MSDPPCGICGHYSHGECYTETRAREAERQDALHLKTLEKLLLLTRIADASIAVLRHQWQILDGRVIVPAHEAEWNELVNALEALPT